MRRFRVYLSVIIAVLAVVVSGDVSAQIITKPENIVINNDSVRREFDHGPYFGLYKDNYFVFGPPIGRRPTNDNTNVKFQISIAQKLTKSVLPWHTYLYLFYTQKVFWNVLQESLPMTDLNFNPGIGLTKPLFYRNRYIGKVSLVIEHESNGRDGEASRSWNRITFGGNIVVDPNLMVHGKVWIPIVDGENNGDILKYCGLSQAGVTVMSDNRRIGGSVVLVKRLGWNLNFNTIVELKFRLFPRDNQYLFFQYYNGFGEGLLDYNKFHSQLRVGICIAPALFSDY